MKYAYDLNLFVHLYRWIHYLSYLVFHLLFGLESDNFCLQCLFLSPFRFYFGYHNLILVSIVVFEYLKLDICLSIHVFISIHTYVSNQISIRKGGERRLSQTFVTVMMSLLMWTTGLEPKICDKKLFLLVSKYFFTI